MSLLIVNTQTKFFMKKTLLFIVISGASLLALVLSGCSKKNDATAPTMKSVVGTYKLTALTATGGGVTVDGMQSLDACQKDDNLKLNADSTYNYIDAGTTCSVNGSYDGQWYISGSYFIQDGDTSTIKSFNGTTLVLTTTGVSSGISVVATETLTKQ